MSACIQIPDVSCDDSIGIKVVQQSGENECDHILAFHEGHDVVRQSDWYDKISHEGEPLNWCCGGGYLVKFCPDCGERVDKS